MPPPRARTTPTTGGAGGATRRAEKRRRTEGKDDGPVAWLKEQTYKGREAPGCEQIQQLLMAAVEKAHNHSVLVVGPKGAGKTTAVERAIANTLEKCGGVASMRVVRLSGLLHANEAAALREIALQLGSAGAEDAEEDDDDHSAPVAAKSSQGDGAAVLGALLRHEFANGRTAVFVLDDFHLFASKSRQGLLYNLLDAMQSDRARLAVVGVTPRHDVVESMEKRVRSRFSHRLVAVGANESEVLPAEQLRAATDVLSNALLIPPCPPADAPAGTEPAAWGSFANAWNASLASALGTQRIKASLIRAYEDGLTPRVLVTACSAILAHVEARGGTTLLPEDISEGLAIAGGRYGREDSIAESSVAELAVLVALHRLEARAQEAALHTAAETGTASTKAACAPPNFLAVCQEHASLSAASGGADAFSRRTLSRALSSLCYRELVGPHRASGSGAASLFGVGVPLGGACVDVYLPLRVMVSRAELVSGVKRHVRSPACYLRWLLGR